MRASPVICGCLGRPLLLGHLTLPSDQLAALRPGDVVIPETALFDSAGHGQVRLGRHCLQVQAQQHPAPLHLTVLALEETEMNDTPDTDILTPDWDDTAHYGADEQDAGAFDPASLAQTDGADDAQVSATEQQAGAEHPDRFDALPLALTVRSATLFHGEQPLAQGELVQIDGRLGLQIVRMDVAG